MNFIQIRTIGEVALHSTINSSVGALYDVPVDSLGIPCIPISTLLEECGVHLPPDVKIGYAHPTGYMSLVKHANSLNENISNCIPTIRSYFLNERFIPEKMCNIRSLKPGQVLNAYIFFDEKDRDYINKELEKITHIGVTDGQITGEVSLKLTKLDLTDKRTPILHKKCVYTSIDVFYLLLTPTCFYRPYADETMTASFIPGSIICADIMKSLKNESIDWDNLIFSNAYLSAGGRRLLPTPNCVSVIKLDKEQVRYRLAPGKDPRIIEQDKNLYDTYTNEKHDSLLHYTAPEIEYVLSNDSKLYEALSPGQLFLGTIHGPDADIRKIAAYLAKNPLASIGTQKEEGFGEAYRIISRVNEEKIPEKYFQKSFDVCCVSNTMILNEKGLTTCRAEDLLKEIEYVLGVSGKLRLVGRYTEIFHDYTRNLSYDEDRTVVRCFAKGSILRIEVIGEPIDISPIKHCFIGERTQEGYGEIYSWPAKGEYYRLGEKIVLPKYDVSLSETPRNIVLGAFMATAVITNILKKKVYALAAIDRDEYESGHCVDDLVPVEILEMLRDQYNPLLSIDEMRNWYIDALKGDKSNGQKA